MNIDEWVVLGLFIITFLLIFSERVPRTTAALVGALALMGFGMFEGFVSEEEALGFIKADVILLLLGMMIVVGVLIDTGFFEFVAIKIGQFSKGNLWLLLVALATVTTFLSMVIDNVTTIILMTPIIIELARKTETDPIPLLIVATLFSNIGGVGTLVGDPPNLIIASHADFGFNDFLIHLFPLVIVIFLISLGLMKPLYAKWCQEGTCNFDSVSKNTGWDRIMDEDPWDKITDRKTFDRTMWVLGLIIVLFLFHDQLNITPAFVAMIGGGMALFVNLSDPERVLHQVEWGTILFFAALFVIVGIVDEVGLLKELSAWIVHVSHEETWKAALLILWLSAFGSAVVNRVPFTVAFAAIIAHMHVENINIDTLYWALAMGVGFGSNLTPLGSSAGTVMLGLSEREGYHISWSEWLRPALPTTLVGLVVSSFVLVFFF